VCCKSIPERDPGGDVWCGGGPQTVWCGCVVQFQANSFQLANCNLHVLQWGKGSIESLLFTSYLVLTNVKIGLSPSLKLQVSATMVRLSANNTPSEDTCTPCLRSNNGFLPCFASIASIASVASAAVRVSSAT